MKIFISQPMRGWTDNQIEYRRKTIIKAIRKEYGPDTQVNPLINFDKTENPAFFLGQAICQLAHSDAAFFDDGWEDARGCRIEHEVCEEYGIRILED